MKRIYGWFAIATMSAGLAGAQPVAPPLPPTPPSPEEIKALAERAFEIAQNSVSITREKYISHFSDDDEGSGYRQGTRALDRRDYERALKYFDRVIASKSPRTDGAYYWKAYALNKLGRREEALGALAEIPRQFPQSRWLTDSRALEAEVKQNSGKGASPESEADDDVKLLAINALINSDPDRTIPLLEKILSDAKNPPRLKERALFILAQSRNEKARDILVQYAKAGSNPDLQREAIHFLGMTKQEQSSATLLSLYSSQSDKSIKAEILQALFQLGAAKPLIEIARKETDPELRRTVVQRLANMKSKDATDYLVELVSK